MIRSREHIARCGRDERGASAMFVVLVAVAMLAVTGLVIDGGYAMGAKRRAMGQAEQAARIGADALDQASLRDGVTEVRRTKAITAATSYLGSVGANGSVAVDGGRVVVTVTDKQPTAILSAVGIGSLPVRASATALSIDEDD